MVTLVNEGNVLKFPSILVFRRFASELEIRVSCRILHCSWAVISKCHFSLAFLRPDVLHLRHKSLETSVLLSDFSPCILCRDRHLSALPLTDPQHSDVSENPNHLLPSSSSDLIICTSPQLCPALILLCRPHQYSLRFSVCQPMGLDLLSHHVFDDHTQSYPLVIVQPT